MFIRLVVVVLAVLSIGCLSHTPPVTAAGDPIRLTSNPATVEDCAFVGNVSAYSGWGGSMGQGVGEAQATEAMLRDAAELGADTVLLTTTNVGTSGATSRGEAFRCR